MAAYCGTCGQPTVSGAAHCPRCGAAVPATTPPVYPPTPAPTYPPTAPTVLAGTRHTLGSDSGGIGAPGMADPGLAMPQWGPAPATPPPSRRGTPTGLLAGLVTLGVLVVAGLAYVLLVRPRQEQQSSAPVTVVVTATRSGAPAAAGAPTGSNVGGSTKQATGAPPSAPPPPTAATSAAPTYPALVLTGQLCSATGQGPWANAAAGNAQTSCPFTVAVQGTYIAALAGASSAPATPVVITAHSTVTDKDYVMTCVGDQPVTCTGGNNAVVYLFGGSATFRP